jgi:hypothetical protein
MISFLILVDGAAIYDEYFTPVWWSKGMLVYTTRIAWYYLFYYFISELRRNGVWACPQLSSYFWWSCEYNMYHCRQNYTFNFREKLMYLSYTTDQPGSSVVHPEGALALFCLWVLLHGWLPLMGCIVKMTSLPGEFLLIQFACQFCWTGHFNSCMFMYDQLLIKLYHQAAW